MPGFAKITILPVSFRVTFITHISSLPPLHLRTKLLEKKDTLEDKLEVVQKAFAERLANLEQIQPGLQHINKDPEEFVEIQESANIITVQGGGELVGNSKADMEAEASHMCNPVAGV